MSNMDYCRFTNTYSDLRQCVAGVESCGQGFFEEELSREEHNSRRLLIKLMISILEDLGAVVDDIDNIDTSFMEKRP